MSAFNRSLPQPNFTSDLVMMQVLEARLERGDSEWVGKHTAELLGSSRQSTGSQQLRCNRTRLMMLALRSRLDSGNSQSLSSVEQKHVFCAWPHSVQVWNLFSRCAACAEAVRHSVHLTHPDSLEVP